MKLTINKFTVDFIQRYTRTFLTLKNIQIII